VKFDQDNLHVVARKAHPQDQDFLVGLAEAVQKVATVANDMLRNQRSFEERLGAKVDGLGNRLTAIEGAVINLNSAFSTRSLRSPNKLKRAAVDELQPESVTIIGANTTQATQVPAMAPAVVMRPPSPMLSPGLPIEPTDGKAIDYVKACLAGRPHKPAEVSRGTDLVKAYRAVLLSTEVPNFTRNSLAMEPVVVHRLLETLEDRIIARFREIYTCNNQPITSRTWLHKWGELQYTTIDNKLSDLKKAGWRKPFDCASIRTWFFNPLTNDTIEALPTRPNEHHRGVKKGGAGPGTKK
jgi:hypothetical protein